MDTRQRSFLGSWIIPVILAFGCTALLMNVWSARKVNKALVQNIERNQEDKRVAQDQQIECETQLQSKGADVKAKDEELEKLGQEVEGLRAEKDKIQGELTALQGEMDVKNGEMAALQLQLSDKAASEIKKQQEEERAKEAAAEAAKAGKANVAAPAAAADAAAPPAADKKPAPIF